MKLLSIFASLVTWGAFATASSFTVPLKKTENSNAFSSRSAVHRDRARAVSLLSDATRGHDVPATNQVNFYTLSVGIGHPPTYYDLFIDSGSSNTFCGIGKKYVRTPTSISTGENLNLAGAIGSDVRGKEYLDRVTLGDGLTITNQSIGDVTSSVGVNSTGLDGVVGVGPTNLTRYTLSPDHAPIPTVVDSLFSQGLIERKMLGVYFTPLRANTSDTTGALTFGGVDPALFKGEVTYAPVTETYPSSLYFGINFTSVTYGNTSIIPNSSAGVVDTGSTMILLVDMFFYPYMQAIPGATLDASTGLVDIPIASIPLMQPLEFMIGNKSLTLDVDAQLIPRSQNVPYGLDPSKQYGTITYLDSVLEGGVDFILGMFFMERYYVVFDTDEHRVGFAETNHTFTRSY